MIYTLNDVYVFKTADFEVAKREVKKYGGFIKDENEKVLLSVSESEKE